MGARIEESFANSKRSLESSRLEPEEVSGLPRQPIGIELLARVRPRWSCRGEHGRSVLLPPRNEETRAHRG